VQRSAARSRIADAAGPKRAIIGESGMAAACAQVSAQCAHTQE
jgi:hypothetical protein